MLSKTGSGPHATPSTTPNASIAHCGGNSDIGSMPAETPKIATRRMFLKLKTFAMRSNSSEPTVVEIAMIDSKKPSPVGSLMALYQAGKTTISVGK